MIQIPVYVFTGFLDYGKTKFIQETLEDPRFNAGERTLLLVFEEGEEEYDFSAYPHKNVFLEVLDQQTVTTKELQALAKKHKAERVVAEMNGMQLHLPDDLASELSRAVSRKGDARQLRSLVQERVEGPLAMFLLKHGKKPAQIRSKLENGELYFTA